MALSKEQELRLQELEKKAISAGAPVSVQTSTLSPEQEARLQELEKKQQMAKDQEPFYGEGLLRGGLKALPAIGAIAGGVLGTPAGPVGMGGGGILGAAAGKSLQNVGEQLLGDEKTRQDIYVSPVTEGAVEGLLQGAGGLIAKGGRVAKDYIKTPIANTLARLGKPAKEGAEEIIAASERLGTSPTRGMLSDDRFIQNLESSIMQTPSTAGQKMADKAANINKAMKSGAEDVFAPYRTAETPNQLAQSARQSIEKGIATKLEPAVSVYRKLETETPNIQVSADSMKRIANNISKLPYVKILGSQESAFAKQINDNLANIKTLDELRNLKSYAGRIARDKNAPSTMRNTAGEIVGKLQRLEQNSITKSVLAIERSKKASRQLAGEMIKEIKAANLTYRTVSEDLKSIAKQAGLGKVENYADFTLKLNELSDEALLQKMFKPNNEKLLKMVQTSFPEAFESMKSAKMMELYKDSLTKGEVSIPKLLNNAKNLSAESKQIIFGPKADAVLKDIETVYNSIPTRVGPSGTPEGIQYMEFNPFSPTSWYRELSAQAKAKVLQNPQLFKGFKFTDPMEEAFKKANRDPRSDFLKRQIFQSTIPRGLMSAGESNE